MFKKITEVLDRFNFSNISDVRKEHLKSIAESLIEDIKKHGEIHLNFICTHNSRRSQFAQLWSFIIADHYQLPIHSYSAGTEVTAFNERAVKSITDLGCKVAFEEGNNPKYEVSIDRKKSLEMYSKVYNDKCFDEIKFIAIMTCSDADKNCPMIPSASRRISLSYEDPKVYDDTDIEEEMYKQRLLEIGLEIMYVFTKVNEELNW